MIHEVIILVLLFVIVMIGYHYEQKIIRMQDDALWDDMEWGRLAKIVTEYDRFCAKCLDEHFSVHNKIVCKYMRQRPDYLTIKQLSMNCQNLQETIEAEKRNYIEGFSQKYQQHIGKFDPDSYPDRLIRKYDFEIEKTYNKYRDLADLMHRQISEISTIFD